MQEYYTLFSYAFASLVSIVNPIGMSVIFLTMTKDLENNERHKIAYKVAIYSTIVTIITFFVGPSVLRFFGISLSSIQVAGGMLVFYYSWGMFATKPKISHEEAKEAVESSDIVFFPLTMPITAGAGSMAVILALAANLAKTNNFDPPHILTISAAILVTFIVVALCYRFADSIFNKLGYTGTHVVTSLAAFILLAIAINLISQGVINILTPFMH